jgi:hypothetical protein
MDKVQNLEIKWIVKKMDLRPRFALSLPACGTKVKTPPHAAMLSKVLYPYVTAQYLKGCLNTRLRAKGWVSTNG